jgi:hypothetical protein
MNPEQKPTATEELSEGRIPRLEDERPADELNTEELKGVVGGAEVPISNVETKVDSGGLLTQPVVLQIVTGTINAINQQNKRPT